MVAGMITASAAMLMSIYFARKGAQCGRLVDATRRKVLQDNEEVVDSWRASEPDARYLQMARRVDLPGFLMPTVTIKRMYRC